MQRRYFLGLVAAIAIAAFEGLVFYLVHVVWDEFWTIVAAEVLVFGGGLVTWTFRPEIMRFIGKAPTLDVQLYPRMPAWHDTSPRNIHVDPYTLLQFLPDEPVFISSQVVKVTAVNGSIKNVGIHLWLDGTGPYSSSWSRASTTFEPESGKTTYGEPPRFMNFIRGQHETFVLWFAYKGKEKEVLVVNTDNKASETLSDIRKKMGKDFVDVDFQLFGERLPEQTRFQYRLDIRSFEGLNLVERN